MSDWNGGYLTFPPSSRDARELIDFRLSFRHRGGAAGAQDLFKTLRVVFRGFGGGVCPSPVFPTRRKEGGVGVGDGEGGSLAPALPPLRAVVLAEQTAIEDQLTTLTQSQVLQARKAVTDRGIRTPLPLKGVCIVAVGSRAPLNGTGYYPTLFPPLVFFTQGQYLDDPSPLVEGRTPVADGNSIPLHMTSQNNCPMHQKHRFG